MACKWPGQINMAISTETDRRDIYNVSRLNREVRAVLEGSFPPVWVEGEISNLARPGSGHLYFSLKDKHAQVRCAMFKNRNRHLTFSPENGMQVIARADVSLYEGRGEFQLIIERMQPAGIGALQQAFAELKERLHKEGLFDPAHKRPLPRYPDNIGVITSPGGAAVRDILHVLRRRYPMAGVIIYPTPVQGEGAAKGIVRALHRANQRGECDVLILARGGGSLEDLWAFNEERLARAIFDSALPVVSGVGHEIDFTIADFIADQRAPTPSAAAELISPDTGELLARLLAIQGKLKTRSEHLLQGHQQHLQQLKRRLPHPLRPLQNIAQHLDDLTLRLHQGGKTILAVKRSQLLALSALINSHNPLHRLKSYRDQSRYLGEQLQSGMSHYLFGVKEKLHHLRHALHTLSPLATLGRGYAIVTSSESDTVIEDASTLKPGQRIRTRLARGQIHSSVERIIADD